MKRLPAAFLVFVHFERIHNQITMLKYPPKKLYVRIPVGLLLQLLEHQVRFSHLLAWIYNSWTLFFKDL